MDGEGDDLTDALEGINNALLDANGEPGLETVGAAVVGGCAAIAAVITLTTEGSVTDPEAVEHKTARYAEMIWRVVRGLT